MGTPVRFPFGVSTAPKHHVLGNFGMPDPTQWHVFFDDFDGFITGTTVPQWTVTAASTGTALASNTDGGALVLTTANTDEDLIQVQSAATTFLPTAGKKLFFKTRLSLLTTASTDLFVGLSVTDTSLISASAIGTTECMGFFKAAAASSLTFYNRLDGSTGSTSLAITGPIVNATNFTLGFYYDGVSRVECMFNDRIVGVVSGSATYLPNTLMTPSVALAIEGTPGAQTATVDYIFAAMER